MCIKITKNMKHTIITLAAACICAAAFAQSKPEAPKEPDYQFTDIKKVPITSVKNQFASGTCWCFSTLGFIESELLRTQKKEYDLSEMWIVSHSFSDRGTKYVRMDGKMGFSDGSGFGDVLITLNKYGMVPQDIYSGMQYGSDLPVQAELTGVLKSYLDVVVSNPNSKRGGLTTAWKRGFDAVIQAYMGQWPDTFQYEGKTYTPQTFAKDVIKFDINDYVNICSFASEPWYSKCAIEVCDNWRNCDGFNVPLDDMMRIIDNAIEKGYTVLWGGDVSEKGFTRNGLAVMPVEKKEAKKTGSDQEHWTGKAPENEEPAEVEIPAEVEVSDSLRQSAYDRKQTTDDHGMLICGTAKDQKGNDYYIVKNSWGDAGKYEGIWYMSKTFIGYKALNIIVNKQALPKDILKKLEK